MSNFLDNNICCLMIKLDQCIAKLGYKIVLKINKGYCVDSEQNKLNYLMSLLSDLNFYNRPEKTVKDNVIYICDQKVFLSKNNSLFLDDLDSKSCQESELAEECCVDLCDLEAKINSICKTC